MFTVRRDSYPAVTIIELMLVMAIAIILMAAAVTSFNGLRDVILINQASNSIVQDIRYAQRAAMTFKKAGNENWVYGIGIDFSQFVEKGEYSFFKWCSQYNSYGEPATTARIPNFDGNNYLGRLSTNQLNNPCGSACFTSTASSTCLGLTGLQGLTPYSSGGLLRVSMTTRVNQAASGAAGRPAEEGLIAPLPKYLLFEAVTGRAFMYDENGYLINYRQNSDELSSVVRDMVIKLDSPRAGGDIDIVIKHISGTVELVKEATK